MKFVRYFIFLTVLTLALFTNCAKRGTITGGAKDTLAPVILSTAPKNFSNQFKDNTILIYFDEYVKLNKVNQQLIISPPMETMPEITPMGYPSKFIKIKIFDTLKPNTTYSFNFGESIQDNNESNTLSNFKYVFATGQTIDSLKLNTTFKDAYLNKTKGTVNVLLYEKEGFNDSTIYKKKPLYVASAKDSITTAQLENLKAGSYYLVALQEKNSNYKFDPKSDKIGFLDQPITLPTTSTLHLKLFSEKKPTTAYRPSMVSQNKWLAAYEGNPKNLSVNVKGNNKNIPAHFYKVPNKDSIYIFTPLANYDSLQFHFKQGSYNKTHTVTPRTLKPIDTLQVKFLKTGAIQYRDTIAFSTNTPVKTIANHLIQVISKDSVQIPFTIKNDSLNNLVKIVFDKFEDEKYTVFLKPNSINDVYDTALKTEIVQRFQTGKLTDYGNITFSLAGTVNYPIIFELLTKDEKVYDFIYITEESIIDFKAVEPDKYSVRIIEDANKNKMWDTGNYLERKQPENVILPNKVFDIRANWELNETITLP
ncbi:Ig-like domain-containing protein [Myroides sp. JBRI-B21084]|uniref:Ig-like domain-containing protein n=1 Tax=Myroides sp. JBRI-B21084 TaxID=3119977 RepID=UPI0026E32F62|nr:Ig-like domain-containing protein [Paenimyroides cloacae]WKW46144.1 Ig-like domain-containing protein [Paenimyroides cloacae]